MHTTIGLQNPSYAVVEPVQISIIRHGMMDESSTHLSWEDIVFGNRNKDYGAYIIRKNYIRNIITSASITFLIVIVILVMPIIIRLLKGGEEAEIVNSRAVTYNELIQPPPIDQKRIPPPMSGMPKVKSVIKYVAPKVTEQETAEDIKTMEEIKNSEIGEETKEGTGNTLNEPVDGIGAGDEEIFLIVEQNPEYPGGEEAMMNFISKNTKYPMVAKQMRIQGRVFVGFVVNTDGKISDVKIERGLQADCDQEAIRVVKSMPPWKPGKQRGKPVRVHFTLPIIFKFNA